MFSGITTYILIGAGVLIIGMGIIVKFQYSEIQTLNQNIATERANTRILKSEIVEQNESIIRLSDQRALDQVDIVELSDKLSDLRLRAEQYKKIFKEHDLERLTRAKPGLIEKRINNGTKRVLRSFEKLTEKGVKGSEK